MSPDIAIAIDNLSRSYKSYEKSQGLIASFKNIWNRKYQEKLALYPTSLTIESGKIVGLVGANGAGKTTLLKLLSGLIHPSQGSAKVLGHTPWSRESEYLKKMSILLGQKNQLWWDISPEDSFFLLAEIYDLDKKKTLARFNELAEILDCQNVLKTQLRRLSLGERMKMEIIGALLHEPQILFLDEPTIGLDIVAQTAIRKFLTEYVKIRKPTVILTSHYMDDIAQLANQLLLISKGQIVYNGTVKDFVGKSEDQVVISYSTVSPLTQDVFLPNSQVLKTGEQIFVSKVNKKQLPSLLPSIASIPNIQNLKFEEANFEEVIHQFLSEESRVLSARNLN